MTCQGRKPVSGGGGPEPDSERKSHLSRLEGGVQFQPTDMEQKSIWKGNRT